MNETADASQLMQARGSVPKEMKQVRLSKKKKDNSRVSSYS